MPHLLEVNGLTGGYAGNRAVLHDLMFHVDRGEMVGMVGLNGAGKSTTIKHILGLMQPHEGAIAFNGKKITEDISGYRSKMAYIPETPQLYEHLTLREHLDITAIAYGIEKQSVPEAANRLARLFNMEKRMDWFPAHFSKGMRQKTMVMCALLIKPELFIVDEPFVGLDPLGIQAFLDTMMEVKENGSGILMSTHILATAEEYCDRLVILHNGQIAATGTMDELRSRFNKPKASLHDLYIEVARGDES